MWFKDKIYVYNYKNGRIQKISNYDSYSVSNLGNVRNDRTNRNLRTEIKNNGYYEYKYM
jgi:hypothetical protein